VVNAVPARATAEIDARFPKLNVMEQILGEVREICGRGELPGSDSRTSTSSEPTRTGRLAGRGAELQALITEDNAPLPPARRIEFRIEKPMKIGRDDRSEPMSTRAGPSDASLVALDLHQPVGNAH
jgi:acetylornithine deacetylase/succinyl-diaminopimelate desuccinylase-like protein